MTTSVWVFTGNGANFASAVFSTSAKAEEWILLHRLSGTLTEYPMDTGVYDWAITRGHFTPKKDYQREADFIASFSSASQEHIHFVDGQSYES